MTNLRINQIKEGLLKEATMLSFIDWRGMPQAITNSLPLDWNLRGEDDYQYDYLGQIFCSM